MQAMQAGAEAGRVSRRAGASSCAAWRSLGASWGGPPRSMTLSTEAAITCRGPFCSSGDRAICSGLARHAQLAEPRRILFHQRRYLSIEGYFGHRAAKCKSSQLLLSFSNCPISIELLHLYPSWRRPGGMRHRGESRASDCGPGSSSTSYRVALQVATAMAKLTQLCHGEVAGEPNLGPITQSFLEVKRPDAEQLIQATGEHELKRFSSRSVTRRKLRPGINDDFFISSTCD